MIGLAAALLAACQAQGPAPAAAGNGPAARAAATQPPPSATVPSSGPARAEPALPTGLSLGAAGFVDRLTGLRLPPQPGTTWHRDFHQHYLTTQGWAALAPDGQPGTLLAALRLDGSNEITAAELRIGRSDDPQVVTRCTQPPAEAQGTPEPVELDGVTFLHFHVADAAMSHYLQVDGYRGLRQGQCVAIDLVVSGTRPEVYDPPRQPPFAPETAQARLRQALQAITWEGPGSAR